MEEVIAFKGEMTIQNAGEFRKLLLSKLSSTDRCLLDLGELTGIDFSGFQLLCAAHKYVRRNGGEIHLKSPLPDPVKSALQILGFVRARPCDSGRHGECLWTVGDIDG